MNPEIKKRWVEALRSGEYRQGTHALKQVVYDATGEQYVKYCCLGVLCDLHQKATALSLWRSDTQRGVQTYCDSLCYLPCDVFAWAGLQSHDPMVEDSSLSCLNDAGGFTFDMIADKIEEHL